MTILPEAVAVSVVIVGAEAKPMFKVPVALLTNDPAPDKAVLTVKVPLLVKAIAEETVAIEIVPAKAWALVWNVAVPVIETVPVLLWVMPLANWIAALAPLSVPVDTATAPVNNLAPVSLVSVSVPPFTVVAPVTVKALPLVVKVVPVPTVSVPPTVNAELKVQDSDPDKAKLPVTALGAQVNVPLPETVRFT